MDAQQTLARIEFSYAREKWKTMTFISQQWLLFEQTPVTSSSFTTINKKIGLIYKEASLKKKVPSISNCLPFEFKPNLLGCLLQSESMFIDRCK